MTAFLIKVIASVCMLVDHIGAVFPTSTPAIFRCIGRVAFPIYAYLAAQGCKYTKSRSKYLLRLGFFALLSEIPFDVAFMHYREAGAWHLDIDFFRDTNVFYTLFLGVAGITVYEKLQTKKRLGLALLPVAVLLAMLLVNFLPPSAPLFDTPIAAVIMGLYTAGALCFAYRLPEGEATAPLPKKIISLIVVLPFLLTAVAFKTDYEWFGVLFIFLLYLAKPENKMIRTIVLTGGILYEYGRHLFSAQGNFMDGKFVVTGHELNQSSLLYMLFALISVELVFFYNGKQGPKVKWAFYLFYPLHIGVLALLWFVGANG